MAIAIHPGPEIVRWSSLDHSSRRNAVQYICLASSGTGIRRFKLTSSVNVNKLLICLVFTFVKTKTSKMAAPGAAPTVKIQFVCRRRRGSYFARQIWVHFSAPELLFSYFIAAGDVAIGKVLPPTMAATTAAAITGCKFAFLFTRAFVEGQLFPTFSDKGRNWITLAKVFLLHKENTPSADPSAFI